LATNDPLGYTSQGYYDDIFIDITAPTTTVSLQQDQGGLWSAVLVSFEGTYQGDVAIADVKRTDLDARFVNRTLGLVQAIGDFQLHGHYDSSGSHWHLDGTANFLAVDGTAIYGSPWRESGGLVLAGLGVLAGLVWVFTQFGKDLRFLFFKHERDEILALPARARLMATIERNPGITATKIMEAMQIKRTNLRHHLRVLTVGRFIQAYQHGTQWHYAPIGIRNTASMPQAIMRVALACMNQPIRRAVIQALLDAGEPLEYERIKTLIAQTGLQAPAHALFAYHAHIMVKDGILRRGRQGHRIVFALDSVVRAYFAARSGEAANRSLTSSALPEDPLVAGVMMQDQQFLTNANGALQGGNQG
jgi:predicted transcriptional regulator